MLCQAKDDNDDQQRASRMGYPQLILFKVLAIWKGSGVPAEQGVMLVYAHFVHVPTRVVNLLSVADI